MRLLQILIIYSAEFLKAKPSMDATVDSHFFSLNNRFNPNLYGGRSEKTYLFYKASKSKNLKDRNLKKISIPHKMSWEELNLNFSLMQGPFGLI
jgi:hypothetical protein